jgi:hypothetical protein
MPATDRVMSRAADMARETSETHTLVKKNAGHGQGDEKSNRDGQGSV